jgi:hypothetical protein
VSETGAPTIGGCGRHFDGPCYSAGRAVDDSVTNRELVTDAFEWRVVWSSGGFSSGVHG